MVERKAIWSPAASGGLLVLLLSTACGSPTASPTPAPEPTTSTSTTVASTTIPAVSSISVRPAPTTPRTTVAATTAPPPPVTTRQAPAPVQPAPVEPPPVAPTTQQTMSEQIAIEGFPCRQQGATAVDPAGRPLACQETRLGRLRWSRA